MNRILTLLTCTILGLSAAAQQSGTVKGQLKDTTSHQSLQGATIAVLNDKDSSLVAFAIAKSDGMFQVHNVPFGEYLLMIAFQGYRQEYRRISIAKENAALDLGIVILTDATKDLGNITIVTPPVAIKGDTTEFNANSFKTKPNATTEDLLKKLPGVQVEKDGTVKAQGEEVKKVLVDGKRFFGDDPKIATKNLPAEVIDKVQVYDAQSEQAAFSGFDDGNREKTINIITKKDRRKGYFGKASAGAGDNERYAANLSVNRFNGNQQLSFIGQANNTNQQNFSIQDIMGVMGGAGMFGGGQRGGAVQITSGRSAGMLGNFIGGSQPGIARTIAGGLNYNDAWSRNTAVSGSYFYNNMNILNGSDRYREFFLKNDSSLFTSSTNESRNKNQNHRFNFEIDQRLDSFNSILIRPGFSYQDNTGFSGSVSRTTKGKTINRNAQNLSDYSDGNGYTFNNSVLFRHRFGRKGRTFSLNLTQSLNNNTSERQSLNYNTFYGAVIFTDTSDYITNQERSGKTFGATASYTEPIGKKSQMELSYNYYDNRNNSDQDVVSYDQSSGKYVQDDTLSNEFYNTSISHRVTASFRRQINKDWNWVAGIGVQHTELSSDNRTRKQYYTQSFDNFFPTLSVQYSKNRARNIRINYRGSTRQPAITQLQDVIDPTNTLSTRRGNAALDQEFVHNINLMYASFDIFTFKNFFAGVNGGFTSNKIANYVTTNSTTAPGLSDDGVPVAPGGQHTTYTNLDGAYNFATFMNFGFPVKKLKGNLNLTSTVALNRDVSMVRDISEAKPSTAYTRNYIFAERLSFNMNIRERFDLNLSGTSTYTMVKNSRQPLLDADYFTQMISLEPTYTSKKGWIFGVDFDYNFYRGQSEGYNQEVPLLNASIAKQLFKNKAGEIRIQAFDLLNQNQSITRTVEPNYVEDANTRVLQRYFMVSFTYHLRKFGQNAMPGFFNIFRGAPMPGAQVRIVN